MKVAIVNCFDTYEIRVKPLVDYFNNSNDIVKVIQSDYMHIKKKRITKKLINREYIHVKAYKKNFSLSRLYSHWCFSKEAVKAVNKFEPDLLYVLIPPNSLTKKMVQYKRNNPDVKLIFDVIDLWPETMPIKNFKNVFPFSYWKKLRDKYIDDADYIITECNLYQEYLNVDKNKMHTIYFTKEELKPKRKINLDDTNISLCYLGSINNIIDIESIGSIIKEISKIKPVILKIIGDGEKKYELINTAKKSGAKVIDYGKIYDENKKQNIFDTCHYGLNIYKNSTVIGLTMKSIDYLAAGLPIINNIMGDTASIIKKYNCGINITSQKLDNDIFLNSLLYRKNINIVYKNCFTKKNYEVVFKSLNI